MQRNFDEILAKVNPWQLSVAVIDLDNVAYNYKKVQEESSHNVIVSAVVKGDSYGLGAVPISRRLYSEGCRYYFVATIEEGIAIREALPQEDVKVFILSGPLAGTEEMFIKHNLTPVLNNRFQADLMIAESKKQNKKLDVVVHIDTGMCRNGYVEISQDEVKSIEDNLNSLFVMSHLACADDVSNDLNKKQLARFSETLKKFNNPIACLSATNGVFLGNDFQFDIVRPGKALYGFVIREDKRNVVKPVVNLFSRIVQVNKIKKGDTVGYGATFVADREMLTVTIGMGYSDGFMRKFSGFGFGFLGDHKMPMIGRISMDYITFDATGVDEKFLKIGNWVALTRTPDYTLESWALDLNTIPHEISCRLGNRVQRIYVGE